MTASARVLVPVVITPGMAKAGTTIVEPDASKGEVAWVASANYSTNNERTYAGSVWICSTPHSAHTTPPNADTAFWARLEPTNRMAPFDDYANTKAVSTGSLTYVIQPGFLNGAAIYGMEGSAYSIVVKDAPGGTVVLTKSGDLYEQAAGFYELLYAPLLQLTQLSIDSIPLAPDAEVSITITSAPGERVALGSIKLGDWRRFIGDGLFGGMQQGVESDRKSYSFRKYNPDGTYQIIKRGNSRNVTCSIVIDASQAMYADAILGEIIDIAVPFEGSNLPRLGYLNTLGFVSGSIRGDSSNVTSLNLKIEGNI